MRELPPDPPRLRAILAYLDQRIAETETAATYLRLRTSAVRQALAAAERQTPDARQLPPRLRSALAAPGQQAGGFVVEKQLHAGHPLGAPSRTVTSRTSRVAEGREAAMEGA
ncbi:hypothetical protein ACH5A3_40925 [Streptomyces echinatus]|uniref:hypothetical protein n=1 Tax=Streptomyces echinatus TaxID=67293 RepID=UPI0037965A83